MLPRACELPLVLSCRCLRGNSAGCYTYSRLQHLPSVGEASPTFQHSSVACKATKLTGLGLPGCPRTKVRGGKPGRTSLFPAFRQDHLTTPGRQSFEYSVSSRQKHSGKSVNGILLTEYSNEWWRRRDLHPPHAACKAASPLWNMRPHKFHSTRRPGAAPGRKRFGVSTAQLVHDAFEYDWKNLRPQSGSRQVIPGGVPQETRPAYSFRSFPATENCP